MNAGWQKFREAAREAAAKEHVRLDVIGEIAVKARTIPDAIAMLNAAIMASRKIGIAVYYEDRDDI